MLRNDYRRALIMLRPLERGYAGHARLERRTLMATLCFTATAPGAAALRAALVGWRGSDHFAAPLGALRRDSRGQYGLCASFDPRNIEGRELEEYQLVVIVDAGDPCRLVLSGNVCGSTPVDWERTRRAACALFSPGANAREARPAAMEEEARPAAEAPAKDAATEWTDLPAAETPAEDATTEWTDLPAAEASAEDGAVEWADLPAVEAPADAAADETAASEAGETPADQSALDVRGPWPEPYEAARALFANGEPMEDGPLAGYVFVRAPLEGPAGIPFVAVGARVEQGVPTRLVYAFPSAFAGHPPAGLEDALWFDDGRGWWLRFEPADRQED
ncbi:MAG TPA: hypothetical protein IAA71_04325 [Candidatus Pullichristensenella stercoripullorum]|nr:hypothetical protein [Candidatus Pullichristensenella stercoripullorum]